MNRVIKSTIFLFLVFVLGTSFVFATERNEKKSVTLAADEVVETDYFAAGDTVSVYGTVQGDAYVAGGQVTMDGTIENDLLAVGGDILLQGSVANDVRVAGGNVTISGEVGGNITVVGGNVMIANNAVLGGNVVVAGGSVRVLAPVEGNVRVAGGSVHLGNTISGDVYAGAGELALSPSSAIGGNLTYMSEEEIVIANGATVSGQIQREQSPISKSDREKVRERAKEAATGGKWIVKIVNILSVYIFGILLIRFFPQLFGAITSQITSSPWKSMGIGFIALIVLPILAFILMFTVIGLPLGFLVLICYFLALYFAKLFIAMVLGEKLMGVLNAELNKYMVLLVGLVVYLLLSSIPLIGALVVFVTLITGLGGMILGKKHFYDKLHTKNLL